MKEGIFKRVLCGLLSIVLLLSTMFTPKEVVCAATYNLGDVSIYVKKNLREVYPQIKVIGDGYLSFSGVEHKNVEKVPLGTVIQGVEIDPKYLDQNNIANLEALFSSVIGYTPKYDKSIAYKELSGTRLQVVAVTDKKVIFWSNGYRGFTEFGPSTCHAEDWLMTHPPGFYQLDKCEVWLAIPDKEYNIIPDGKEKDIKAKGIITMEDVDIQPKPSAKEEAIYGFSKGDEVSLASTKKISAIDGSGDTYYKVIWQGYMSEPRYCYVNTIYVDAEIKGSAKPSDLKKAHIINVKSGKYIDMYASKDINSKVIGRVTKDTNVKYSPSKSDKEWVTIWFSGQKCYIPAKYIKEGEYIPLINTGNLGIKDIVDGQYVMTWDPVNVGNGYTVAIVVPVGMGSHGEEYKYLYRNNNYSMTEFTISNSMFIDGEQVYDKIHFKVKANSGTETFTSILPRLKVLEETKKPTWDKAGGIIEVSTDETSIYLTTTLGEGTQMQVSTDKNFKKNVKTTTEGYLRSLESGTTYYVRFRHIQTFTTVEGKKLTIKGKWSNKKKIKTDKAKVYDYVPYIEVIDVVNGEYVVSWPKVTNTKSYTVKLYDGNGDGVHYTNKNYKSNTFTVKNKYMKKANGYLAIGVEANKKGKYPDEEMTEVLEGVITSSPVEEVIVVSKEDYAVQVDETTVVPKCKIKLMAKKVSSSTYFSDAIQIQYADNKSFKNAKTTEIGYSGTAEDLELDTTYYFKYRYCKVVHTRYGNKVIYGNWSKSFSIKTQDKVSNPTISG